MEESSLFKSLSKGVPRASHEGSVPSNLAQRPPALSITTSLTPRPPFTGKLKPVNEVGLAGNRCPRKAPRDENKAHCEHKFVLAPNSTNLLSTHVANGPYGNTALTVGGDHLDLQVNARRSPLPSAATLEALMKRVCGLDLRSCNLASLARYLPDVSTAPAGSSEIVLSAASAETEDLEDWEDLGNDVPGDSGDWLHNPA